MPGSLFFCKGANWQHKGNFGSQSYLQSVEKTIFFSISSHFGDQEGIVLGCDCALICMPILVHKSSAISFLLYSAFSGLWII